MPAAEPFFSVIIPVFNRAGSLRAAIASVQAQSFQDFEIVVVDDGSRDDPGAVVAQLNDPRIRLLVQENKGGGAARNTAIDAARGRFIAPLDSDDVFLPHHLETMKGLVESDTDVVGYARILVNRGGGRSFLKPPRAIAPGQDMGEYLLCARGFLPTITLAVPRELAARVRYHTNLRPAEDTDFAIRLARTGVTFKMAAEPGAIWNDLSDPTRASAHRGADNFGAWLESVRPAMTDKAYRGGRGWAYAKLVARRDKPKALWLYARAVAAGCYAPRLAVIILLQILLSTAGYRRLADHAIGWLRTRPHGKDTGKPDHRLERAC